MECEMCGQDGELKRTKVEGTELKLCESCQEVGEVVQTASSSSSGSGGRSSGSSTSSSSSSRSRKRREEQDSLLPDFDDRVRDARADKDLSKQELADEINVKESVISRIESGSLKPDKQLAKTLKQALDVSLYGEIDDVSHQHGGSGDDGEATIGDVADIRRK